MLPSRKKTDPPATAYGIFIGYTLTMDDDDCNLPQSDFLIALNKKLTEDVINHVDLIENEINTRKLRRFSFYIYLVAFNDAEKDKAEISKFLIG